MGYSEKILHALQTKESLVESIKSLGVDVDSSNTFRQIANKFKDYLNNPSEGPSSDNSLLLKGVEGLTEEEIFNYSSIAGSNTLRWSNFFKLKPPTDWTSFNETIATQVYPNCGSSQLSVSFRYYGGDTIDVDGLNLSNIPRYTYNMFCDCYALKHVDLSKCTWAVTDEEYEAGNKYSSYERLDSFFQNCFSLESVEFGEKLLCTPRTTTTSYMFGGCRSLTSLDLSKAFNTSSVTSMGNMFYDCRALHTINFGDNFNTDKVTYANDMFRNCTELRNVTFSPNWMSNKSITSLLINYSPLSKTSIFNLLDNISDKSDTSVYTSTYKVSLRYSQKDLFTEDELTNLAAQFNAKGWTLSWS